MSLLLLPEYIQIIMTLEEAVQHVVMMSIQEVSPSYVSQIRDCQNISMLTNVILLSS